MSYLLSRCFYFTHVINIMKRKPECLYIVEESISLATKLSIERVYVRVYKELQIFLCGIEAVKCLLHIISRADLLYKDNKFLCGNCGTCMFISYFLAQ